jgi:YidC/Oxa1 family membrane protein insertase
MGHQFGRFGTAARRHAFEKAFRAAQGLERVRDAPFVAGTDGKTCARRLSGPRQPPRDLVAKVVEARARPGARRDGVLHRRRLEVAHRGDPDDLAANPCSIERVRRPAHGLQMPIWIALYAMLFFAFELRQQPAFFGVFQLFGGWGFLGDLSAPDRFIPFPKPIDLWLFSVSGLNVLPLLMGLVFWFQQKYMTPPTTATLTDEQKQQQKIMKIMMVVMFPVMLYAAPSGLTLYILTSSCMGIVEGRVIRKRIAYLDTLPKDEEKAKPSKTRDKLGRMYAEALERAQEKQRQKQRGGKAKRFKDRK